MSELQELQRQLKLPIGYEGQSYEDAVRDLDGIINRLIKREQRHARLVEAAKNYQRLADAAGAVLRATHVGDQNFVGLLRHEHAEPIRMDLVKMVDVIKDVWDKELDGDDEST